jgi:hypothetical protein
MCLFLKVSHTGGDLVTPVVHVSVFLKVSTREGCKPKFAGSILSQPLGVDDSASRRRSSTAPVENVVEAVDGISRLSFVKRDASFGLWAEVMLGHTAVEVGVFKHVLIEEAIEVVSVRPTAGVPERRRVAEDDEELTLLVSRCILEGEGK